MTPDEVRRAWAGRTGAYSPDYYAYRGSDDTSERVRRTIDGLVDTGVPVLEVGCGPGRHLAHLHEHGFSDLHGLDVNDAAFDVLAETYPALAEASTFHRAPVERAVEDFRDDQFGAIFTVETLQHVHDAETWVFAELARAAADVLLTVECETPVEGERGADVNYVDDDLPLYYREWDRIFTDLGLVEVESASLGRDTLRAFRHVPA